MTQNSTAVDTTVTHLELGCGSHKRPDFFGIDVAAGPSVDLVLDIEREPLPFPDNSIDHVYSSHTFEHLVAPGSPIQTLREIMRVTRHGGLVEIWTPFGRSDDGLLFGHGVFYTETHWKHICYQHDDFYLGEGTLGRFNWLRTEYVVYPQILERLDTLGIPADFALVHMSNIALEFGVFLEVDKTVTKAVSPQIPIVDLCTARGSLSKRLIAGVEENHQTPPAVQVPPADSAMASLRRRISTSAAGPPIRKILKPIRRAIGPGPQGL